MQTCVLSEVVVAVAAQELGSSFRRAAIGAGIGVFLAVTGSLFFPGSSPLLLVAGDSVWNAEVSK